MKYSALFLNFLYSNFRGPIIPTRKRKYEDDDRQTISNILQREVARLDSKFLVDLNPSFCSNNGTVHLICKLGEFRCKKKKKKAWSHVFFSYCLCHTET